MPLVLIVSIIGIIGIQESFAGPAANLSITDLDGKSAHYSKSGQQLLISHNVGYHVSPNHEKQCIVQNTGLNCSPILSKSIVVGDEIHQGTYDDKQFTMIFQVQDQDGRTVYLSWVEGTISPGQVKNMESAWMPEQSGSYTATAFVWSAIDNPTALSPPISSTIRVN